MNRLKTKKIENSITEFSAYQSGRRSFLKRAFAVAAFTQIGFLQSCVKEYIPSGNILSKEQFNIIIKVQNILFPKDDIGPGAFEINAHEYLLWVLADDRLNPDDLQYIINGISWINETAQENQNKEFLELSGSDQSKLISTVSRLAWGESWLSVILNYIFEAMLSDPLYGYNKGGIGWKWLEHQVGYPRPEKDQLYDNIFKTVNRYNR